VAFRDAHHAVGAVVKLAETHRMPINQLPFSAVAAVHPAFAADWVESFDLPKAMARRKGTGMPGPGPLAVQFKRWRKTLG